MLHQSESVLRDQVTATAKQMAKKKSRKYTAIGAAAAVVLTGGAAWAAVQLLGFGDASVDATATQNLTIDNFQTTSPLYPGATVDAKAVVHNPNNFPVNVTAVIIREEGLGGKGTGCDPASLVPRGTKQNHGSEIGNGYKTVLETPVSIAPKGAEWVTLPQAVSQKPEATAMCGFEAKIAVQAETGS